MWQGRVHVLCAWSGKGSGLSGDMLGTRVCTGMLPWLPCAYQYPLSPGRVQFPLPIRGAGCWWQARGGAGEGAQPLCQQDRGDGTRPVLPHRQPRVPAEGEHGPGARGEGRDGPCSSAWCCVFASACPSATLMGCGCPCDGTPHPMQLGGSSHITLSSGDMGTGRPFAEP